MQSEKKIRKLTLMTIFQSIFLNIKFFIQNRLLSYAGACSFSFLFSFIPVFVLIIVILVRFLHASPQIIETIFQKIPELSKNFSTEEIFVAISSFNSFHGFEIILGIFIFWMARRFFASISDSFQNIFHTQVVKKGFSNQIFTFFVEALTIIVVAAVIFIYNSIQTVFELPFLNLILSKIPQIQFIFDFFVNKLIIASIIKYFPNILILVVLFTLFRMVPRTKPKKKICFLAAFLCTFTFFMFKTVLHHFLDVSNYNLIYGVLGQGIILLMDIYFFFTFFLFFAQFIFVYQFFDELLIGELYLLQKQKDVGFLKNIKCKLFSRPDFLLAENQKVIVLKKGTKIFNDNNSIECAYYVVKGKIIEEKNGKHYFYKSGNFFGEIGCILKEYRISTTYAEEDSQIIKIEAETFKVLTKKNPEIAKKVLESLSSN